MYIYNIFNICNILRYLKFIFSKHKYLKCKCNYFFKSKCNYFFRRNGAGLVGNKRVQNAALGCSLINGRMIYLCFQGQSFNITLILVYAPNTTAKDAEVHQFYEDLQDLLYLTLKKKKKARERFPFHHKELECKRRKSRDIQNNRQVWPCSAKWRRAKTNRVLSREHGRHRKHPLSTKRDMTLSMDITRWSIRKSNWLYCFSLRRRSHT